LTDYAFYLLLGTGAGAVIAILGLGVVLTYRGSGVVNFAHGAVAMWTSYVFYDLRVHGAYPLPVPGLPSRLHFDGPVAFVPAFAVALLTAAGLGIVSYALVFRPLRGAPILAKVVASVGVLLALIALVQLRFEETTPSVAKILPSEPVTFARDLTVPRDGLWLGAIAVAVAAVLWAVYRFTRFGLATRAAAENEKGAITLGYSPDALAAVNWVVAALLAGIVGVLGAPLTQLTPGLFPFLYFVPALGAALLGRLTSFAGTCAAGLAIGMVQSVFLQVQNDVSWWPKIGAREGLPFVLIVVTLVLLGKRLPTRDTVELSRLPKAPVSRPTVPKILVPYALTITAFFVLSGGWRVALLTSLIFTVLALSLVVLTGFVGQISLAQMAFAGVAGFALSRFAHQWHVPFPIAPILAALVATVFGVAVGMPALRVRGINLAIVTLAGGVAIQEFVFKNPTYTGGIQDGGAPIPNPRLFGLDLGLSTSGSLFRPAFGVLVTTVVALLALAVANLRRGTMGRRMLAVRANERAAAAAGIDVASTKLLAFAISSFVAGLGGTLIAYRFGSVSDASYGTFASLTVLAFAYLGGITTVGGAIAAGAVAAGGILFYAIRQVTDVIDLGRGNIELFIGGVALVVTAILNPEGMAGAMRASFDRARARRRPVDAPTPAAAPTMEPVA
jgi:branched-chain amino acid transport system permease protein